MNTITLMLTLPQIERLYEVWHEFEVKAPAYSRYQLKPENCTITAYQSNKVVFQGKDAAIYAAPFQTEESFDQSQGQNDFRRFAKQTHAGSDEVGTGDYFGSVCVCACAVEKQDLAWLETLKVNDSKQINDEVILKTAPLLMERLAYSLLILPPAKYNQIHQQCNMNQIKAILHNQAYVHLKHKRGELPKAAIVDQFTPQVSYYRYCKDQKEIVRGLHFETKAESHYPAVACASMIARCAFLKAWTAMENQWDMTFSKGAGSAVDQDGAAFVRKHGEQHLKEVAKLHFKNTEKVADLL